MGLKLDEWMEKDFNEFIKSKGMGVVEFGAPWCAACKKTEPIVAELAKEYKDVKFAKIDVAKNPGLSSRMGVRSLPNIIFLNGGKVKDQIVATTTKKAIEDKIAKLCSSQKI